MTTAVQQERERDSELDEIWCVLDHDERDVEIDDFRSWLGQQPNEKARSTEIRAAISTPCFEYWLLLHFEFTIFPRHVRRTLGLRTGPETLRFLRERKAW